jgi:hypothetical protein
MILKQEKQTMMAMLGANKHRRACYRRQRHRCHGRGGCIRPLGNKNATGRSRLRRAHQSSGAKSFIKPAPS